MDIKRLSYTADVKAAGETGVVEAIVSVFDIIDRGGDIMRPGAFAASIARKLPNFVWSHDWDRPIGKTLVAEELEAGDPRLPESCREFGGLYVKGQCNLKTQRGKEAYEDLKLGAITEFSIGFRVVKESYNRDTGVRELLEVELFEWSPVLVGMNQATATISVKSDLPAGSTLDEQAESALAAVKALVDRLTDYGAMKSRDNRRIPESRIAQAKQMVEGLQAFIDRADAPNRAAMTLRKELLEQELWRLQIR